MTQPERPNSKPWWYAFFICILVALGGGYLVIWTTPYLALSGAAMHFFASVSHITGYILVFIGLVGLMRCTFVLMSLDEVRDTDSHD